MKKFLFLIVLSTVMFTLVGCKSTTFTPYEQGVVTGNAVYIGYARVAMKEDDEFKAKAAELWKTINEIQSYDDLAASVDKLTNAFDLCIKSDKLTPEEKVLCAVLKKKVCDKVGQVLANKLESNENAVEFLKGVRDGVNELVGPASKK